VNDLLNLHGLVGAAADAPAAWVRPPDWLPLPEVLSTEQKIVGLHVVHPTDGNFLALLAQGAYTVDWGDGTSSNHASNTIAYKEYTYSSISSATECSRGYRQVLVTVTPQAGQNLTVLNLKQKHNQTGLVNGYSSGWLDVIVSMPNCTASGLTISSTATATNLRHLERVAFLNIGAQNTLANMFVNCTALQSASLAGTAGVTNTTSMFSGCSSLRVAPMFDTSAVNTANSMFLSCTSLEDVPLYDFAGLTSANNLFQGCISLQSVPSFSMPLLTSLFATFNNCTSLQRAPLFATGVLTGLNLTFNNCTSLASVPAFNCSSVNNTVSVFGGCVSLSRVLATGIPISFTVANCKLSAAALDEIYTNLPTVTGQTITVTGNYGTTGHTPSIATAKGWTVTA
jgi:hypothetical protein